MITLDDEARTFWQANRYVRLSGALSAQESARIRGWALELERWPEAPGRWMKYFEPGEQRLLCRVEDFLPYHDGLRGLLTRPDLFACLSELLGEPAVLFKEKLNFKLAGGAGFSAHQDAPAFASFGQVLHVTLMLSIDASTPANGCLEVVPGWTGKEILAQAEDGTLAADVEARLAWKPLETESGDVVLFDSFLPHRSGPNASRGSRRALYVTYNRASEGDRRAEYFALKRRAFPPECERIPGAPLDAASRIFNLGNPIR